MENKKTFQYLLVVFVYLLNPSLIFGQSGNLNKYIPFENTNLNTHPELIIKTWVHIIQKENNNPENLTEDSLEFIENPPAHCQ